MWTAAGIAGATAAYAVGNFLLTSTQMALIHPDQISVEKNHYVAAASVREIFITDRGKSILRIPVDKRRRQLESIPWVEHATVRRVLPNRVEVEITERTPIAFLRDGTELSLIDAHGMILDRPLESDFHFPVVTGIHSDMPLEDREQRMQLYSKFLQDIGSVRASAADQVSEVDLSDVRDVRATLTGVGNDSAPGSPDLGGAAPVLVHFGDSDFAGKYQTLVDEFGAWRAKVGRIESVDLRFSREAVVNQDPSIAAQQSPPKKAANALLH